jgi:hypothetical protein
MGPEVQRKLKPKEINLMCDLFFCYGINKYAISAQKTQMVVDLFLLDVAVISTTAFNTVYDIFMGTQEPKKKIDYKKIDRNKLAIIKRAGKKYIDNLKEEHVKTFLDVFLSEQPVMKNS